jgi:hypothetical protein
MTNKPVAVRYLSYITVNSHLHRGRGRKEILILAGQKETKRRKIIPCLAVVLMDSAEGSQRPRVASRALTVFGLPISPGN